MYAQYSRVFDAMNTITKNAISNRMKEGNRNLSIFDFSRKEDLRSYLNHNKKRGLKLFFFFLRNHKNKPKQAFGVFVNKS